MNNSFGQKLEKYTLQHPEEVLIVTIEIEAEIDKIIIYKGFSSSLMGKTAFDPDIPIIPATAKILTIDRLQSPYQPNAPRYIQENLTWEEMEKLW